MNVRRCVYNMVYSNEKTTISGELFNKIMQCYKIECYMAIKKDGIVLFININVHIRIFMKRTCCKTVCTLQYDLISSICLNSYSCIYRPEYQWAGVSGCWHYRCYLSFSFLIFFEVLYWACVIFIIGKKALNLFPPSLSSYFLVIKWGWHVLLWCRTFRTWGSVLRGLFLRLDVTVLALKFRLPGFCSLLWNCCRGLDALSLLLLLLSIRWGSWALDALNCRAHPAWRELPDVTVTFP